ncbi:reverse transcriptase domain-containing protein [Tanacetum coccineum]
MAKEYEEKIAFITSQGIFCYTKMPFGLRNAEATYQRLVDKAFHKQIGRNLEVYVDGLVIKSRTEDEIVRHIEETFKTLREINMKLNPKKCTFRVEEGMFLGYKVNTKGLKMKQLIAKLPMLTAPMEKEELIVYLAATKETVSAVLMTEREAKQMPIYFVSRALRGPKLNYTSMEKPRVSVKGQILADFIVERPEEDSPDTPMKVEEELPEPWIWFTDGSSCTDGSGAGLILTNPEGMEFTYALRFRFDATINEAEYEALIAGLRIAEQMGVKNLQEYVDSRLVANQVNGTYVAKEADMIQYLEKVKTLTSSFKAFSIRQVPRSENKKADALSKKSSTSFAHFSKQVLVEELKEKSISEAKILAVVEEEGDTWMTPVFEYLTEETLPSDEKKSRAVRRKSQRFAVINEILYKKSFLGPWLRCVGPLQANYVLKEIYEGSCSMHAGTRSVVAKALRIGYYWPTMHKDARALIKACQECQVHKPIPRNPQQKLTPITSPWPFYKWGIDIVGPFPEGPGKVKFLIEALTTVTKVDLKQTAVQPSLATKLCEKLCIRQHFASVKHPQTNGLVERANRSLGEGIKARLGAKNKNRLGELSHVLWAHRTMIKSINGETLFSLTYGTEAVIPAEIGMPTLRTVEVDLKTLRKLCPKWEGPYEVTEALGKGAYKLRDRDGKQLPWTWKIGNLKKCYVHKM